MKKLLLVALVLSVFSTPGYAEESKSAAEQANEASAGSAEGITSGRDNKWYAGGGAGINYMKGWDSNAMDGYYRPRGYWKYYEGDATLDNTIWKMGAEVDVYAGYRLREFMDVEIGYFRNFNDWYYRATYENSFRAREAASQAISASAYYMAGLYRPIDSGFGRGLYLKFGGHRSKLHSMTKINGIPFDVNSAGLGGSIPSNGTARGNGTLFGIGFDARIGSTWAVRLESARFNRLGGTRFGKDAWNVGINARF